MTFPFGAILGKGGFPTNQFALRAQVQWARIQDKSTDIILRRNGVDLPIQTVRLEQDDTYPQDAMDDSGKSWVRRFVMFGVRGHPDIDDLDVDAWDTFVMEDQEFTVVSVNRSLIGQIQAVVEAVG